MPSESHPSSSFATKYVLSCAAATVAETSTYPLDLTKTRLQLQGGPSHVQVVRRHRGLVGTAVGIVEKEGATALWRGVRPAILRHYIYTGCRMPVYEELRENIFRPLNGGALPIWAAMCSGLTAGIVSQLLSSPMDLVKVQMQNAASQSASVVHTLARLVREGRGVSALWRGCVVNCQRAALVNCADMATYDNTKQYLIRHAILPDDYRAHVCSSVCSGLMAAIVSTPADVVKTRVMNQPIDPATARGVLYSSSLDCVQKTVRQEGFMALYKGFVPIWARMAPWSLTFWVSYEKIRSMTGQTSF